MTLRYFGNTTPGALFLLSVAFRMADLTPVAFDIETSGLDTDAVITVAGLAHELGEFVILNTGGRDADQERIGIIETRTKPRIKLSRFLRWLDRETHVLI